MTSESSDAVIVMDAPESEETVLPAVMYASTSFLMVFCDPEPEPVSAIPPAAPPDAAPPMDTVSAQMVAVDVAVIITPAPESTMEPET